MPGGPERVRVAPMPDALRRINLEIDEEQPPLHGHVAEGGVSHEFEGWLGLLTVLGSLLDGPAPGDEPSSPTRYPT